MGHHFVPQRYLRHFAVPGEPGMIWMYDKTSGKAESWRSRRWRSHLAFIPMRTKWRWRSRSKAPPKRRLIGCATGNALMPGNGNGWPCIWNP